MASRLERLSGRADTPEKRRELLDRVLACWEEAGDRGTLMGLLTETVRDACEGGGEGDLPLIHCEDEVLVKLLERKTGLRGPRPA